MGSTVGTLSVYTLRYADRLKFPYCTAIRTYA